MEEEHYDTPWEFKNRAIAAALSKSTSGVICNDGFKPSTSSDENIACDNVNYHGRKKFSSSLQGSRQDPLKTSKNSTNVKSYKTNEQKFFNHSPSFSIPVTSLNSNKHEAHNNLQNNRNGGLRSSTKETIFNVYANDPVRSANSARTNFTSVVQSPTLNVAARASINSEGKPPLNSYDRRRFSASGLNQIQSNNAKNHIKTTRFRPSDSDAIIFGASNMANEQKQIFSQLTVEQCPPVVHHRNRYSFDEFETKKAILRLPGADHLQTPSTSSSSSASPFTPTLNSPNYFATKNKISPKNDLQNKFLETYPLVNVDCTIVANDCICSNQQFKDNIRSKQLHANSKTPPTRGFIQSNHLFEPKKQFYNPGVDKISNLQHTSTTQSKRSFDEANMVHDGLERTDAEKMLKAMEVGDFLLRRRNEGNLALSLRSTDGVLHIKLEMRDGYWILGEGPSFPTIGAMLRCYRRTELPVRGAEHVRLKTLLKNQDAQLFFTTKQSNT